MSALSPTSPNDAVLDALEEESIFALREAYARLKPMAMLWSIGKDSNTLLWLVRKAFLGRVPFPVMLLDTGNEFAEVYAFRDLMIREWKLEYINAICPPVEATDPSLPPNARAAARKTLGLAEAIVRFGLRGVLFWIRRDEQPIRSKERMFSPRSAAGNWDFRHQPVELWGHYQTDVAHGAHVRVHPLLSWTEIDVWRYIRRENIPVVPLYFARAGWRYRSLGESDITHPIRSSAGTVDEIVAELEKTNEPERAGRSMDHESEDAFERLRTAGYM